MLLTLAAGSLLTRPVHGSIGAPPRQLGARDVVFRSESGAAIHGWFARGDGRGTVLLLPGVRANRTSMLGRALFLKQAGYGVLLVDFQATGESRGEAITFGWRERLDVLAATKFLREHAPGEPVAILGSSLGGAATLLALPALRVDAAVLEAVYPTVERAVENRLTMRLGAAGKLLVPLLLLQLEPRLGIRPEELRPVERIDELACPVLVIGGAADRHTTATDTRTLFEAAREPKDLWLIDGAAHVDFHRKMRREYESRVLQFLGYALVRSSAST